MSKKAKVTVHPDYRIAEVDRRLFSAFLEPIGNWVEGGIWNPEHKDADDMGFRKDIIDAIKKAEIPAVRMPGGNFTSGWKWEDSIGPVENRKTHLDLAWRQYQTNRIGHDEYLEWARRAGLEAMYTINMGTADIESAMACVEYTNHIGGSYWSDMRIKNGYKEPHNVKLWYLGNEMDGPWQIASWSKDPKGYGIKVNEVSKAMKWIDPSVKTIASGTSMFRNASYPQWDADVLEQCYENVDYLSLHYYHGAPYGNYAGLLNGSTIFEEMITTEIGVCDYIKAKVRSPRTIMISFDEYACNFDKPGKTAPGRTGYIPPENYGEFTPENLQRPFRHQNVKSTNKPNRRRGDMLRALNSAAIIMVFLRHTDRVKIGCMTGAIRGAVAFDDEHVWESGLYHAYSMLNKYSHGMAIMPSVQSPTFNVEGYRLTERVQSPEFENVPYIEAAAVHDEEKGEASIFIVNRNWEEDIELDLDVRGFENYEFEKHIELQTDDLDAYNTFDMPMNVYPREVKETKNDNGKISLVTKKLSFNLIRLKKKA